MENLITCSICLRKFEDPRVLPCQHTFCLKPCLERLYDTNLRHIKCPLCRVPHHLLKGNVRTLPKNFTIQSLIDMPNEKNCELCKTKTTSSKNCECCTKDICEKCYDSHLEKTKASLLQLSSKLKWSLDREKQSFLRIRNDLQYLTNEKQKLIASISQSFEEIIAAIQQRKADLIGQVNGKYAPAHGHLKQLEETKEIDVAVLSSSLQSVTAGLRKGNSDSQGHLMALVASIQSTLPASVATENGAAPLESAPSAPGAHFTCDWSAVKQALPHSGQLHWSNDDVSSRSSNDVFSRSSNNTSCSREGPASPSKRSCSSGGIASLIRPDQGARPTAEMAAISANGTNNTRVAPTSPQVAVAVGREKTFLLNRLPKAISYDILN